MSKRQEFREALMHLINKHGMESVFGNTPDFILAGVAYDAMNTYGDHVNDRDRWYGVDVNSISADRIMAEQLLNTPGAIMPSEEGTL